MRYTKLLLSIVCCLQQHNGKIECKFKPNLSLYQCCHVVGGRQLEVHAAFLNHTSIVLLLQPTNIWNVFSYFNVAHLREIFYLCLQYFSNTMMFKDLFSLQKILKFIDRVTTINTKYAMSHLSLIATCPLLFFFAIEGNDRCLCRIISPLPSLFAFFSICKNEHLCMYWQPHLEPMSHPVEDRRTMATNFESSESKTQTDHRKYCKEKLWGYGKKIFF